eukprot:TRINITY_DN31070_c0_g1_i1.p1 TRINITY_DN31070_c0_g1~~TRINITY_DN31070_c0_g1_i1.p1  ORF type:complete len:1661 (+),score=672.89 TRINITY_DN31070_c0_g1_i1:179-5161(+)
MERSEANKSLVQAQIQAVINALRRHGKWTQSLGKLLQLRSRLRFTEDLRAVDGLELLDPFLHVIASKKSNWFLTNVSLLALNKLVRLPLIGPESSNFEATINHVTTTVVRSKFADVTRPEVEELVEVNILKVLLSCIQCPAGRFIKTETVLEVVHKCFEMITQPRKTDVFQDAAESILRSVIESICTRPEPANREPSSLYAPIDQIDGPSATHAAFAFKPLANSELLLKMLTFLCSLLRPGSAPKFTDSASPDLTQAIALDLISSMVEFYVDCMDAFTPEIVHLLSGPLCQSLLNGLRTTNVVVFSRTLRIFFHLYLALRHKIKLQLELFFTSLMSQVLESKTALYAHQELALEIVVEFFCQPNCVTDLYINYDCNLYCSDVFESLCRFLYRNAFPVSGALNSKHLLSLEGLQAIMHSISVSCEGLAPPPPPSPLGPRVQTAALTGLPAPTSTLLGVVIDEDTPVDVLRELKQIKQVIMMAIDRFNAKDKDGIRFLQDHGLLTVPLDPRTLASFFRNTPGLDKTMIGKYLGERDDINVEVLQEFIRAFVEDFSTDAHSPLVATVRAFLESFRLPGDAHIISRVFENFAQTYFEFHSKRGLSPAHFPFTNADQIYIMCYSIVMLNVDLHNPGVKKKMTLDEYVRRTADTDDTRTLPPEIFGEVYECIQNDEIRIPEENPAEGINENTWHTLLRRADKTKFTDSARFAVHINRDIFSIIWGPIIAAFSVVFDTTFEDSILDQSLRGFDLCARISAFYNLNEVFDNLVISICKFSTLPQMSAVLQAPADHHAPTPAHLASIAAFSGNKKAQLATLSLFRIISAYSNHLREGWKNILDCLVVLHRVHLLPNISEDIPDYLYFESGESAPVIVERVTNSSLFSSLLDYTNWFSANKRRAAAQKPPSPPDSHHAHGDPAPKEDAALTAARELVAKCNVVGFIHNTRTLNENSLVYLVKSVILASARDRTGQYANAVQDLSMFYLDLLTLFVRHNMHRISLLWPTVFDYVIGLLGHAVSAGSSARGGVRLIERTVGLLLLLCDDLVQDPGLHGMTVDEVVKSIAPLQQFLVKEQNLIGLAQFNSKDLMRLEEKVAFGIAKFLASHASRLKSQEAWGYILPLLEQTKNKAASKLRFRALCHIVQRKPVAGSTSAATGTTSASATIGNNHAAPTSAAHETGHLPQLSASIGQLVAWSSATGVSCLRKDNFAPCLELLTGYASHSISDDALCLAVVQLLESMFVQVPSLLAEDSAARTGARSESWHRRVDEAFTHHWLPVLSLLGSLCRDPRAIVRDSAFSSLSKCIMNPFAPSSAGLSPSISSLSLAETGLRTSDSPRRRSVSSTTVSPSLSFSPSSSGTFEAGAASGLVYLASQAPSLSLSLLRPQHWAQVYDKVVFPALSELLSTEEGIPVHAKSEPVRLLAIQLLSKSFLQYLPTVSLLPADEFNSIWKKILHFFSSYIQSEPSENMREASTESLKNILLVMSVSGIFQPRDPEKAPVDPSHAPVEDIWEWSWRFIHTFCPGLVGDMSTLLSPTLVGRMPRISPSNSSTPGHHHSPAGFPPSFAAPPVASSSQQPAVPLTTFASLRSSGSGGTTGGPVAAGTYPSLLKSNSSTQGHGAGVPEPEAAVSSLHRSIEVGVVGAAPSSKPLTLSDLDSPLPPRSVPTDV